MQLDLIEGRYAICRLPPEAVAPTPPAGPLWSLTRTEQELSLVTLEEHAPTGARIEAGWRALRVRGPLAFDLTGVLASLTAPLAKAGVALFAVSTYDTDWILVKDADLERACVALTSADHEIL